MRNYYLKRMFTCQYERIVTRTGHESLGRHSLSLNCRRDSQETGKILVPISIVLLLSCSMCRGYNSASQYLRVLQSEGANIIKLKFDTKIHILIQLLLQFQTQIDGDKKKLKGSI